MTVISYCGNASFGQAGNLFQQIQYLCLPFSQVDWTSYWTTYCVVRFQFNFIFDAQIVFQKPFVKREDYLEETPIYIGMKFGE